MGFSIRLRHGVLMAAATLPCRRDAFVMAQKMCVSCECQVQKYMIFAKKGHRIFSSFCLTATAFFFQ